MGANSPQEKKVRKFRNLASKEANFVNLFLGILIFSFLQHSVLFQTISVSLVGFLLLAVEPW